jgi:NADH pyrophosphatase NudC (nudix superfamily)
LLTLLLWCMCADSDDGHWWSGNDLDRSSCNRKDNALLAAALQCASSLFLAVNEGSLLCTNSDSDAQTQYPRIFWLQKDRVCAAAGDGIRLDSWEAAEAAGTVLVLLGTKAGADGRTVHHFAVDVPGRFKLTGGSWLSGRDLLTVRRGFGKADVAIAGQALALVQWHNKNRFIGTDGARSVAIEGGAKRKSAEGSSRVYPRVDTAAIFLVVSPDGQKVGARTRCHCPASRANAWPGGCCRCFSASRLALRAAAAPASTAASPGERPSNCLAARSTGQRYVLAAMRCLRKAGSTDTNPPFSCVCAVCGGNGNTNANTNVHGRFVEPGESVEEATRREALEEAGAVVGAVALHSTQPWPIGRAGR